MSPGIATDIAAGKSADPLLVAALARALDAIARRGQVEVLDTGTMASWLGMSPSAFLRLAKRQGFELARLGRGWFATRARFLSWVEQQARQVDAPDDAPPLRRPTAAGKALVQQLRTRRGGRSL